MRGDRINILVFEKTPAQAGHLCQALADSRNPDIQAVCVPSVKRALELIREGAFDLILFSLVDSDSQGMEHLGQVQTGAGDVPIIVIADRPDGKIAGPIARMGIPDCIERGHFNISFLVRAFYAFKLKRAEETIRKKDAELSDIEKMARIGSFRWDIATNEAAWSDELYRIFGLTPQEIVLNRGTYFEFIHPEDRERVKEIIDKAIRDGKPYSHKYRIIRPDGAVCLIHARAEVTTDRQGKVVALFGTVHDITEQNQTEDKLRQNLNLLNAIIEGTNDHIYALDREGRVLLMNSACALFFGKSVKEIIGRKTLEFIPPELARKLREDDNRIMQLDKPQKYEENIAAPDGTQATVLSVKAPFRDQDGNILGILGISRDITDRKVIEEKLRTEHAYRKPIEDAILAGIGAADLDGKLIYVNAALCKMVGWKEEELIGLGPPHPFWPPEDSQHISTLLQKRLNDSGPAGADEIRFRRRNGEEFPVMALASPLTDGHGKKIGILAAFYDITEQKRTEDTLNQANQMLQGLIQASPLATMVLDLDGTVRMWSPAAERIFGWREDEVLGRILPTAPEGKREELLANLRAVAEGEEIIGMETTRMKKGNIPIDVSLWAVPLIDGKGNHQCLSIVSDISEKKRMETELVKVQKMESLGVFAGGIAHDFNNILTIILGNISLAKSFVNGSDQILGILTDAENAAVQAKGLSAQLLTFAKGGNPVKKSISIGSILESSIKLCLTGANVKVQCRISDDLCPVDADEGQIGQVVQNLVINAKQAAPEGGTIHLVAENFTADASPSGSMSLRKGRYVKVSIKDNGTGIPKEILPKIFDPFFTTKQKGSGLGLSIAHSIIQKHDGLITVESQVNQGTTFVFYLPAATRQTDVQEEKTVVLKRGHGRVLVVDDDETILRTVEKMLRHLGYEGFLARSGSEAMQKFHAARDANKPYDAVITDLTMPGDFGGLLVLERLKEIDPSVKVVIASGYSNDPVMADYRTYGFSDIMIKPYSVSDLSNTLHNVFHGG